MLTAVIEATNKMIDTLRQENEILIKGQYTQARLFSAKKEKITNMYKTLLENLNTQTEFLATLSPAQKALLRERFSLCGQLNSENKMLLHHALNANSLFLKTLFRHLNIEYETLALYKPNGCTWEPDRVRAPSLTVDAHY